METEPNSLYTVWQTAAIVITAIVSFASLGVSAGPKLVMRFKGEQMDFTIPARAQLTHKLGIPNLHYFLQIDNSGGKDLRVQSVVAKVSCDGAEELVFDEINVLPEGVQLGTWQFFVPFKLKQGDFWLRYTSSMPKLSRKDDQRLLQVTKDIRDEITSRTPATPLATPISANPVVVAPCEAFFDEKFYWKAGEYTVSVSIEWSGGTCTKNFRFVLHESQSQILSDNRRGIVTGDGVYWNSPGVVRHVAVYLDEI